MPHAQIASIYRYPVKGLSPEPLPDVALAVGQTLPADRRYAIENGPSGFDPATPAWMAKTHFLMLMRNERLAALQTHFDDRTHVLTIRQNGHVAARGDLETTEGCAAIEAFFTTNFAGDLKGRLKVISGGGHSSRMSPKRWSRSSISAVSLPSRTWSACPFIRCGFAPTSMSRAGRHGASSTCSAEPLPSARRGSGS
jgi:hypothetical protein